MRTLILSDIHSNLEAFQAVLEDAAMRGGFDEVWCLGDLVGYGPDPGECIELLRRHDYICVAGNHDLAVVGKLGTNDFVSYAAFAVRWTATQLVPEHAQFLSSLPAVVQREDFTLVHGSLRSPALEYLLSPESAMATFQLLESRFCLVGHSHIPFICHEGPALSGAEGDSQGRNGSETHPYFEIFREADAVHLGEERLIINPGGAGQPRDGDPRPSYALYDSDEGTIRMHRVSYEIEATQEKMRQAGLPDRLIQRLSFGV